MRYILLTILLFRASFGFACSGDFECGYGNKCVKPSGSFSLQGTCVKPTDGYGNRDYNVPPPSYGAKEVGGCQFNTDCNVGFSCMKRSGQLYGICAK